MFVTKVMVDEDMFCYIHERGQWITSLDGSTKYSGSHHKSIDVNCNMSHTEFVAIVCGVLDIQPLSAKISFTLQFDPSCLVPLVMMHRYQECLDTSIDFFVYMYLLVKR